MPKKMDTNIKISIVIPVHEMPDWERFIKRSLATIESQTYRNYEVLILDNSDGDNIYDLCKQYRSHDFPNFYYAKNPKKGMAPNTNAGIKSATGDIIKIIYMDDYLAHQDALKAIVEAFDGEWLVTGCLHDNGSGISNPHFASYNDNIHLGANTIGSPSVLAIKNRGEDTMLFDEKMQWLLDCDYYKRMYEKYGAPTILDDLNVVIGLHEGQMTNTMGNERKKQEEEYIKQKYDNRHSS